ncbi:MAG: amidohydrolase [Pseudomonadota bacterium]
MSQRLFRNFAHLVCGDAAGTCLSNADLLTDQGVILEIGEDLTASEGIEVVDCTGLTAYPGLVNTHHHFFQAFVRNLPALDWTRLTLLEWLDTIYPIFSRIDEDCIYHSSIVSMADLIKHGCTTAFDHQYNYTVHGGSQRVDRQFEAAALFGLRFHAGRGCNTLPQSEGSTIPDAMLESTDAFLKDCERLIDAFHDPGAGSMRQVVIAPCQPVNAYPETFIESVALARDKGVSLHTHLGEGENAAMEARFGRRSLDWCEQIGFVGEDTWLAHGWEFTAEEIDTLARTGTGLAHCPAPVFLVGAEVTNIPAMAAAGVRLSLGADGQASNDGARLTENIRLAYLLQCLTANQREHPVPAPYDFLRMGAAGGAACLNREDIGELAVGMAADFFAVDLQGLESVGANERPQSYPAKVGLSGPVDMTVVAGDVLWERGEFPGLDEGALRAEADASFQRVLGPVLPTAP